LLAHIVAKDLNELFAVGGIQAFNCELSAENVCKLGPVSVTTSSGFVFVVIEVGPSKEMAKD
jgi:hypothetical protein